MQAGLFVSRLARRQFSLLANFMVKDTDISISDCVYNDTKEQK